ncbi:MAG: S-methyl-5'-thioinosine phosphorylase [Pseudomonadota bacterium]
MNQIPLAIIGGTGLTELPELIDQQPLIIETPYGIVDQLHSGIWHHRPVIFLARHGHPHRTPPHHVNYRANIWALHNLHCKEVIAVNAVGGISKQAVDCALILPDQLIDYTFGRAHTFFEDPVQHIEFTEPYDSDLRRCVLNIAHRIDLPVVDGGIYGCTQGPRLETAAEIQRLAKDGCSVVGMTGMPEAVLARELGLSYASICLVVNRAAGLSATPITMEMIKDNFEIGIGSVKILLSEWIRNANPISSHLENS